MDSTTANCISIAWHNLHWSANQFTAWRWQAKIILNDLTGSFTAGSLNSLLGPSGAGKTTLLNVLSGTTSSVNSPIYLGGQNHHHPKSTVSYFIKQHVQENIVGELTIEQILRYAFAFKNERASVADREKHITATMAALMLPADLLSRPFAKCSGGEQKRVAIAQELMSLTAPAFLFVDEPTTGLDSASAFEVMFTLKRLATKEHITVITSIHAPNDETLRLFDQIYVLAKGGVAIYSGPPADIRKQLERQLNLTIPPEQPPIEALLKIACNGSSNAAVLKLANRTALQEVARFTSNRSSLSEPYRSSILTTRKFFSPSNLATHLARQCRTTFLAQWRLFLFLPLVFLPYFCSLASIYDLQMTHYPGCYPHVDTPNRTCNPVDRLKEDDLVKMNGNYILFVTVMVGFIMMITSTMLYSRQLQTLQAEHRNHWYSIGVFYASTSVVAFLEMNFIVFCVTLFSYFLSNQHAADSFSINWTRLGFYAFFIWLQCLYNQALGHLVGIFLLRYRIFAIIFCSLLYATFCMFNGLYIKLERFGNETLKSISDALGMVYLTRGMYYSIFGIGRCDEATEYSWVLLDHHVEVERIGEYVWRVGANILIIKLATLVALYWRFNSFEWSRRGGGKATMKTQKNEIVVEEPMQCLEMDEVKDCELTLHQHMPNSGQIAIAWRSLSLYASSPFFAMNSATSSAEDRKLILRSLNGQFRFGTLNALMSTSGAGKTSFLRVLNGQCRTRLSTETAIYLSKVVKIRTCFITQEVGGHLMSGLTARQAVMYASRLKNSQEGVDHDAVALKWLRELDLSDAVDTRVEHCSGGERKRLAVAQELTSARMPNLICIDEPTSGLDSNSAETVIATLRRLSQCHSIAIVTSIHQPTTEILHLFDQLYVLARGGVCIYSGPPTAIQDSLNEALDKAELSAISPFPIEALIKYSCSSHLNANVQRLVNWNNKHLNSTDLLQQAALMPDGVLPNRARFSTHSLIALSLRMLVYIRGYLWIEWLFYFTVSISFAATLRFIFPPTIITASGCITLEGASDSCTKTAKDIEEDFKLKDNIAYIYFSSSLYQLLILLNSAFAFYSQFAQFTNEHRNGWYSTGCWYLVKSFFELVPIIPTIAIYAYILDMYAPVVRGGIHLHTTYLMILAAAGFCSLGHCFNLLTANISAMTIILITTSLVSILLDNSAIHIEDMPYYWQMLSNFSISRFLFSSIMLLQYGFGRCAPKQIQTVLDDMSVEDADYGFNVVMLAANLVLFRVLAFCLLLRKANPAENRQKRIDRIVRYTEWIKGGGKC